MKPGKQVTVLLGIAGLALVTTIVVAAQTTPSKTPSPKPQVPSPAAKPSGPIRVAVSVPPLPSVGFAPVRPMDVVRATYDFAANHPEILRYVPCYCGCGEQGHKANESCFVARRDQKGNVLEWDTHGFGCTICIDVARESMQLYNSGADVVAIRAAIEKRWAPSNAAGRTPTPAPPAKK
jgi:hypothetical protein